MNSENQGGNIPKIRANALRQAAKIAESEQSPLAVEIWNEACRRIQRLLGAEAAKIERSLTIRSAKRGEQPQALGWTRTVSKAYISVPNTDSRIRQHACFLSRLRRNENGPLGERAAWRKRKRPTRTDGPPGLR